MSKRLRSGRESFSHSGSRVRKKRRVDGQQSSVRSCSSSEESSSGGDDEWISLAPGATLLPATLERMKQRNVLVNDEAHHFEYPDGHLVLKRGDVIGHKCKSL